MKPVHEIPTHLDDINSTLVQKSVSFQQNQGLVPLSSPNPFAYSYMPKPVKGSNKRVAICAYC